MLASPSIPEETPPTWLARSASVVGAGVVASVAAAAIEARGVAAQTGSWLRAFQAEVGILALIGLGVSVAVAFASCLVHGAQSPLAALKAWLLGCSSETRARWVVLAPVTAVTLLVGLLLITVVSTRLLSQPSLSSPGFAMALSALFLALGMGGSAWAVARSLARGGASPERVYWSWGFAVAGFSAAFLVLVSLGTTSGQGPSFQSLGVFRREELDLRAVTLVSLVGVAAYLMPLRLRKFGALAVLCAAIVASIGASILSGTQSFHDAATVQAVERYAPLSKLALGPLRRWTDMDGDGFSAWFGGGDCNGQDPSIHPKGEDIEANQVDEDCSGRDALPAELATQVAPRAAAPSAQRWPDDLNVLLITVDTLRADLGYLGYHRKISPNLDKLAAKSIVYENAYSLASYTSKSLPQMLIGKYASETNLGFRHFNKFGPEERFFPERIQSKIHTLSVQAYWYFHEANYGFERGFSLIDDRAAPRKHIIEGDHTSNGDELTDNALAVLRNPAHTGRRFYMWIHYVDPHAEYVPHAEFDFGRMGRERYDGEIAFVDRQLGRIFDFLEQSEFGKRTAIVFTSDHGEAFGEHGMYRHGYELWEELVRVPLLLYVPGIPARRVKERRSIIDVAPTLVELMGAEKVTGQGKDFMSGQSLVADFSSSELAARPVFMDMSAGPYNEERQALIDRDLKLVMSDGKVLGLYDLAKDPGEKQDLASNLDLKEKALSRFKAFKKQLREVPLERKAN